MAFAVSRFACSGLRLAIRNNTRCGLLSRADWGNAALRNQAVGRGKLGTWTNHERIGSAILHPSERGGGYTSIGRPRELRFMNPRLQQSRYLRNEPKEDSQSPQLKVPTPISTLLPTHENIYTLPNLLTFSRLLAAPIVGYLLLHSHHTAALSLFIYAGITDLVDGWIARKWKMESVLGTIIDPMADKALMTIVTVGLAWGGSLPVPLAVLILGRDILLSLTAFYYRYISLPPPRTFARYWDFSLPSAEVKPTTISKVNTFLQLGLIGATMSGLAMGGLSETPQALLEVSWWIVGATTVASGVSYLGRGGVRILGKGRR